LKNYVPTQWLIMRIELLIVLFIEELSIIGGITIALIGQD